MMGGQNNRNTCLTTTQYSSTVLTVQQVFTTSVLRSAWRHILIKAKSITHIITARAGSKPVGYNKLMNLKHVLFLVSNVKLACYDVLQSGKLFNKCSWKYDAWVHHCYANNDSKAHPQVQYCLNRHLSEKLQQKRIQDSLLIISRGNICVTWNHGHVAWQTALVFIIKIFFFFNQMSLLFITKSIICKTEDSREQRGEKTNACVFPIESP